MKKIICTIAFVSVFSIICNAQSNEAATRMQKPANNQVVNPDGTTSPAIAEPASADRAATDRAATDRTVADRAATDQVITGPATAESPKSEPKKRLTVAEKGVAVSQEKEKKQQKKAQPAGQSSKTDKH